MKCQILFSWKIEKNIVSLSSAEFTHSMVSVRIICNLPATFVHFLFCSGTQILNKSFDFFRIPLFHPGRHMT